MNQASETFELLDTVALLEDVPDHSLLRGNVGTVVERLDDEIYMVDSSTTMGIRTASCRCERRK